MEDKNRSAEDKSDLPAGNLVGRYCQLPDGQLVIVEIVHPDGRASVRRVSGERRGTRAETTPEKLRPGSRPGDFASKIGGADE
jgi:hypothetical protein